MAKRRMFSKDITETDRFTSMPEGARLLYFVFGMNADDDGFVPNPEGIIRQQAIARDNFEILIIKKFIIPFESGVIVIRHWRKNNYIPKDRYTKTDYVEELSRLIGVRGEYLLIDIEISREEIARIPKSDLTESPCIQDVYTGKVRLGEVSTDNQTNQTIPHEKPNFEQVETYCKEKGYLFDCRKFFDKYSKFGWQYRDGKKIDWRQKAEEWNQTEYPKPEPTPEPAGTSDADEVHQNFLKAMGLA